MPNLLFFFIKVLPKLHFVFSYSLCFYNVIAFGGTKQIKQPKDLFKLPWDTIPTETKDKVLSKAEFLEKAEKIKQSLKINNIPGRSNVHQVGWGQSKIKILKKLQTDIFIDDKYETFKDCHKNNIFCLLMDAPHNQKYKTKYRIYDLNINTILEKYNKWLK